MPFLQTVKLSIFFANFVRFGEFILFADSPNRQTLHLFCEFRSVWRIHTICRFSKPSSSPSFSRISFGLEIDRPKSWQSTKFLCCSLGLGDGISCCPGLGDDTVLTFFKNFPPNAISADSCRNGIWREITAVELCVYKIAHTAEAVWAVFPLSIIING